MILGCSLLLCTVVFGFGMQIFERALGIPEEDTYDKFLEVANSMWIVILGITTVGYGDITPNTHIARLITAAGCFIGNIILILMTIVISNMINHNEKELKAYSFINNFKNRYDLRNLAAVLIQRYYKYNMHFVKKNHPGGGGSLNSSKQKHHGDSISIKNKQAPLLMPKGGTISIKIKLQHAVERFREYR
jgi:hypothetical protein